MPFAHRARLSRMADPEAELVRVARRYEAARARLARLTEERIEVVRRAREAGVPQRRVMELTGLSRQRVQQIRSGQDFIKAHRERARARRAA